MCLFPCQKLPHIFCCLFQLLLRADRLYFQTAGTFRPLSHKRLLLQFLLFAAPGFKLRKTRLRLLQKVENAVCLLLFLNTYTQFLRFFAECFFFFFERLGALLSLIQYIL